MKKVITYGTYDLFHFGHTRLLERAKELGDYLIVGVTADDFDKSRGKINVQQSLIERLDAVKSTGLADEIIVEEYEGQKIDDIRRYGVDVFAVGSDWEGRFDYLAEYCEVVYLERTDGISSSNLRCQNRDISLGIIGETAMVDKFIEEGRFVNGIKISGVCHSDEELTYNELIDKSDAFYIVSDPNDRYRLVKDILNSGRHVLCESPIAETDEKCRELIKLAEDKKVILMEAIKTAYSTAYHRLNLLAKSGLIGRVVSVDATCTSLKRIDGERSWSSIADWGPTAMLPIFQILGTDYITKNITSLMGNDNHMDEFTKIEFTYKDAVASLKVGNGVKSEGTLVITGTKGYIYVPAPWWKTDYFEIRYENQENNKRHFYQLDGEGIRYEIVEFLRSIEMGRKGSYINEAVTLAIASVIGDFNSGKDLHMI